MPLGKPRGCPFCKSTSIGKTSETKEKIQWTCYYHKCRKKWEQLKFPFYVEEKQNES